MTRAASTYSARSVHGCGPTRAVVVVGEEWAQVVKSSPDRKVVGAGPVDSRHGSPPPVLGISIVIVIPGEEPGGTVTYMGGSPLIDLYAWLIPRVSNVSFTLLPLVFASDIAAASTESK